MAQLRLSSLGLTRCHTSSNGVAAAPASSTISPVKRTLTIWRSASSAKSINWASTLTTSVCCLASPRSCRSRRSEANNSGVVKLRRSFRSAVSLAACRRMKIILARRSKASVSKPVGRLSTAAAGASAAGASPGTLIGGFRSEPITGASPSRCIGASTGCCMPGRSSTKRVGGATATGPPVRPPAPAPAPAMARPEDWPAPPPKRRISRRMTKKAATASSAIMTKLARPSPMPK